MFFMYLAIIFIFLSFCSVFCDVKLVFCSIKTIFCRVHFTIHFFHFNLKWTFFKKSPCWFSNLFVFLFIVLCSNYIEEISFWSLLETQIRSIFKISPVSGRNYVSYENIFSDSSKWSHILNCAIFLFAWQLFSACSSLQRECNICPESVVEIPIWILLTQEKGKGRKDRFRFMEALLCWFSSLGREDGTSLRGPCGTFPLCACVFSKFGGHLVFSGKMSLLHSSLWPGFVGHYKCHLGISATVGLWAEGHYFHPLNCWHPQCCPTQHTLGTGGILPIFPCSTSQNCP